MCVSVCECGGGRYSTFYRIILRTHPFQRAVGTSAQVKFQGYIHKRWRLSLSGIGERRESSMMTISVSLLPFPSLPLGKEDLLGGVMFRENLHDAAVALRGGKNPAANKRSRRTRTAWLRCCCFDWPLSTFLDCPPLHRRCWRRAADCCFCVLASTWEV